MDIHHVPPPHHQAASAPKLQGHDAFNLKNTQVLLQAPGTLGAQSSGAREAAAVPGNWVTSTHRIQLCLLCLPLSLLSS